MKIKDVMLKELMILPLTADSKAGVIEEMTQRLFDKGVINDLELFRDGIHNREAQSSTGLGDGIAMPHAKKRRSDAPSSCFCKERRRRGL